MKVTGFRTRNYVYSMDRPIGDANFPGGFRDAVGSILYVDTDEGITGIALGGGQSVRKFEPLIVGQDPRGVTGLWKRMIDQIFKTGNGVPDKVAIGAIDIALWDLKAKINDEPLWKTLGALEGRCKAYASGIDLCLTDDEIFAFYRRMAEAGVDGGKLKVGLDLDADIRRLGIMKEALSVASKRPMLTVDSNEYWSPKQAIRHIQELEKHFDITWAEEPARRWDYRGLKLVSDSIRAAVATGENVHDVSDFYALIANQAVDIVEVGGLNTTGITGAMQVAHMAHAFELPVAMMNCPANFMSHLSAALPNHLALEVVDPGREPCFTWDSHIEDGWIVMGNKPGLGIEIDEKKLAQIAVESLPAGRGLPPGRREGAGLYEVPPTPEEVVWERKKG